MASHLFGGQAGPSAFRTLPAFGTFFCPPQCLVFGWSWLEGVKEMLNSNFTDGCTRGTFALENTLIFYPDVSVFNESPQLQENIREQSHGFAMN